MSKLPAHAASGRDHFLRRACGHLLAAVAVIVLAEVALFQSGAAGPMARAMRLVPAAADTASGAGGLTEGGKGADTPRVNDAFE